MSRKSDAFYFDNLIAVSKICVDASKFLVEFLKNYDVEKINESIVKMHGFEHAADIKKHEMIESLSKAFITPLEREDLAELSYNLDEVADDIEEVLQCFYMDEPKFVTDDAILLAEKILECCEALDKMFAELHNFKKPANLRTMILKISDIEEECDKIYMSGYKNIKNQSKDVLDIITCRKIYEYLERCVDSCEHVADVVDMIVMKNS